MEDCGLSLRGRIALDPRQVALRGHLAIAEGDEDFQDLTPGRERAAVLTLVALHRPHERGLVLVVVALAGGRVRWCAASGPHSGDDGQRRRGCSASAGRRGQSRGRRPNRWSETSGSSQGSLWSRDNRRVSGPGTELRPGRRTRTTITFGKV